MSVFLRFLSLAVLGPVVQAADDILRFENGDQLHGSFQGISDDGSIRFQNAEMKQSAEFGVAQVRHVVLRGGKPEVPVDSLTHVELINADLIPGKIGGFDGNHVTLESGIFGSLQFRRDQIRTLAVNPMGGHIHYHGPFSEEGWEIIRSAGVATNSPQGDQEKKPEENWEFGGSAWYWKGEKQQYIRSGNYSSGALVRKNVMTDCSTLRFRLDWRDRLGVSVVFHADFDSGDPQKDDDAMKEARQRGSISAMVGNAYVLQIYSSHAMLYRSIWGGKAGPEFERLQDTTSLRLTDDHSAKIEVRSNRATGRISLFVDDQFVTQWSEEPEKGADGGSGFAGKGGGIGFAPLPGTGAIRVSELVVSEWNGLPDSARSMKLEERDVVLMTNGTDRFSGKAVKLDEDGKLVFESAHGTFHLPLDDIEEIRFASSGQGSAAPVKDAGNNSSLLHLSPVGRITVKSMKGTREEFQMEHPLLGGMKLSTGPLVTIEYEPGERLSDFWNEDL